MNCCLSPLFSSSTLLPFPLSVWISILFYTYTVCNGGSGYGVLLFPLQVNFFRFRHPQCFVWVLSFYARNRRQKSPWHNLNWKQTTTFACSMYRELEWVAGDLEPAECSPLHPHFSHAHWLRGCRPCVSTNRRLNYCSADFLSVGTRGFSYIQYPGRRHFWL